MNFKKEESITEALLDQNFQKNLKQRKRKMDPKRKIQGRKTSKKANRKMDLIRQRDLFPRIFGHRPTFSKQIKPNEFL